MLLVTELGSRRDGTLYSISPLTMSCGPGGKLLERDFSMALNVFTMTWESQDVPHSFTDPLIQLLVHSLIHSFTHSVIEYLC